MNSKAIIPLGSPVDIIVPVYDGFEETKACLESLFRAKNKYLHHIVVINDASPNDVLTHYLRELADKKQVDLYENETNLGFVATVNKGMRLHLDRDVVLQNSDTLVANDWLDRMVEWAYSNNGGNEVSAKVASVTPFSTNAEICSFPTLCKSNNLIDGFNVANTDKAFSEITDRSEITLPTGVGFSMYLRRDALNEVGYFDEEAFGRGYGEENDWCRRAIAKGYRHLLATNVFVFHEGGVSFSDQKAERVKNALQVLDKRYPDYHREVHTHIQENPARALREKVQLDMLLKNSKPKILYITHHMGGGIQSHIKEMQAFFSKEADILILRPTELNRKDVELCYQAQGYDFSLAFLLSDEWKPLLEMLRALQFEKIHFHHLMRVPEKLWSLAQVLNLEYQVTLHDYYFINGNPTLTDGNGSYVEQAEERDVKCAEHYAVPDGLTLNQWHQKMKGFLMGASQVFAPSQGCAGIYQQYFSELDITVAYHVDAEAIQQYPAVRIPQTTEVDKLRVLVIGAISREKGADIFEHTACHKDPLNRLEFHLIGYAYKPLRETITSHGAYRSEELAGLINQVKPHVVWFPAQWPETYCYVLSEAMQMGLPVLAPNLGSFPERVQNRPASFIKPWNRRPEEWKNTLIEIREWMISHSGQELAWDNNAFGITNYRYSKDYCNVGATSLKNRENNKEVSLELVEELCKKTSKEKTFTQKERFLAILWRLRELPVFRSLQRLVPFEVQRKIKRLLSPRPIHEVLNDD